jgi:hypothetical protein
MLFPPYFLLIYVQPLNLLLKIILLGKLALNAHLLLCVKHSFEETKKNGIRFSETKEIFADVEGSVAAHQMELA